MRLKTIVIDDEPLAAMLVEGYVQKTAFLEHIATFSTAVEVANSELLAEADLLFLDIQMPMLTGLEFSRMVNPQTRIIFTTAFDQYAIEGYRVNALDYLLKPITYGDFLAAAQKALSWFEIANQGSRDADSIYVKSEYKLLRLELDKIIYIEGLKDYVKFVVEGEAKPILSLMNMKRVEQALSRSEFIRVHRSFIVRRDRIRVIERSQIIFGEVRIPIGENYKSDLQEWLQSRSL